MKIEVDIEDSNLDRIIINDLNIQLAGAASEGNEKMVDVFRSVIKYYGGTPILVVMQNNTSVPDNKFRIYRDGKEVVSF